MKIKLRKMMSYFSTVVVGFAMIIAAQSIGATCLFLAYQPEVPKELQEKNPSQ